MKYYITQAGVKFLNEVNKSKYKDMKFQQGGRWGSDMEIERRRPRGRTGDSAPSPFGWSSAEWESLKKKEVFRGQKSPSKAAEVNRPSLSHKYPGHEARVKAHQKRIDKATKSGEAVTGRWDR